MMQEIITYIIIFLCVASIVYSLFRKKKKKKKHDCDNCDGCDLKDIMKSKPECKNEE